MSQPASTNQRTELLRRLVAYEGEHSVEAAELVEPFDGGRLVISPELDQLWRANYVEPTRPGQDAGELAELAEDLLGSRGFAHRNVLPADPVEADRLAQGFAELGWEIDRSLYMTLARPTPPCDSRAEEVPRELVAPIRRAARDEQMTPRTVEQMLVSDARLDELAEGRWFAASHEGELASACVLYSRGGVGQVETVITSPGARRRGLARAVVTAAIDASRRAGHELTFIVADADDWPWRFYERLGFDRVGVALGFLRKPRDAGG